MSLIQIAWRNFCHRSLSSILTTLSLALGVGLVVLVLSVYGVINEAFTRNATVGYNLVVGPKGSPLQLTLNSVFYLSQPIENLPYTEYMEFLDQDQRAALVKRFGGPAELATRGGRYAPYVTPNRMANNWVMPFRWPWAITSANFAWWERHRRSLKSCGMVLI
jgi:putative ABC transport system permease protein